MESKVLKQQITLVTDGMGMRGAIEKRVVAEEVFRQTSNEQWSAKDEREAKIRYLIGEVTTYMNAPLPEGLAEQIAPNVPSGYAHVIAKLPRFICISERGGLHAKHVMAWLATPDEWDNNFRLKAFVAERATSSRNAAREIRNLLMETKAGCLAGLSHQAAE